MRFVGAFYFVLTVTSLTIGITIDGKFFLLLSLPCYAKGIYVISTLYRDIPIRIAAYVVLRGP